MSSLLLQERRHWFDNGSESLPWKRWEKRIGLAAVVASHPPAAPAVLEMFCADPSVNLTDSLTIAALQCPFAPCAPSQNPPR